MEKEVFENGTEVLIFNYIHGWKEKDQDFERFIKGTIINSKISDNLSYHGSPWNVINYTVLGEDGKEYFGNYRHPLLGDSFFMTEEDYILYLKRKIKVNEEKILEIEENNKKINEIINKIQTKENTKLVPVFATKEQEELFAKCAKETMLKQISETKDKVRKR